MRPDPAPPAALLALDATAVRAWCASGRAALAGACEEIDDLNVYPVPDGDTGTNLLLTMASVDDAVRAAGAGMRATVGAMAHGALMGARGNSGVILSQLLRGLAEVLRELDSAGPEDVRRALTRASVSAYSAVATPVEGTLLTVARVAAETAASSVGDLSSVVTAAREGAARALASTPDLLPVLAAAGVVDAGGRGLVVLLEALEAVVTGRAPVVPLRLLVTRDRTGLVAARESGSEAFGYEVQYLLHGAADGAVDLLREQLHALGDSLVVVGGDGLHNVHVHVNDVGAALEAGVRAGRPERITVTRFSDQVAEDLLPVMNERPVRRAVVAVAPGAGLAALLEDAGATVVPGGPGANPSTAELLDAVRRTGAGEVVVLPGDANVVAVARAAADAARRHGLAVHVLPTHSPLQGLAALAVADPDLTLQDDVAAMAAAARHVRWGEVTRAVRAAQTPAGPCEAGAVLGLLGGEVVVVGTDVEQVGLELVARLVPADLLTVVSGRGLPPAVAERLAQAARETQPSVEVLLYDGGQPHYALLLGAE